MKKLICLLLVVCILCPLLVGCGWQDDETRMKKAYLRKLKIKDKSPEDVIIEYDGGTYNGARIVMLDAGCHDSKEWTETVGGFEFKYYDTNRLYVYKYGCLFSLEKAYKCFILKKSDVQEIAENYNNNITSYVDICDKYDFEPCQEIMFGNNHNRRCYGLVWIGFYGKIVPDTSNSNLQNLIKYVNSHMGIYTIATAPYLGFGPDIDDGYMGLFSIKNVTQDNFHEIKNKLSRVPGVKFVACACVYEEIGQ